jgi:hypothetical protein
MYSGLKALSGNQSVPASSCLSCGVRVAYLAVPVPRGRVMTKLDVELSTVDEPLLRDNRGYPCLYDDRGVDVTSEFLCMTGLIFLPI